MSNPTFRIPTAHLRFRVPPGTSTERPVLQQWWTDAYGRNTFLSDPPVSETYGEWRDVPTVAIPEGGLDYEYAPR